MQWLVDPVILALFLLIVSRLYNDRISEKKHNFVKTDLHDYIIYYDLFKNVILLLSKKKFKRRVFCIFQRTAIDTEEADSLKWYPGHRHSFFSEK